MQRTKTLHVDILRSPTVSEKQLLRDKCQWYMRKYEEAMKKSSSLQQEMATMEVDWHIKWEALQDDLARSQERCAVLEQHNEKLLSVIASLKKPPKRKPLPPKKVSPQSLLNCIDRRNVSFVLRRDCWMNFLRRDILQLMIFVGNVLRGT
jgi:hypothetical protein